MTERRISACRAALVAVRYGNAALLAIERSLRQQLAFELCRVKCKMFTLFRNLWCRYCCCIYVVIEPPITNKNKILEWSVYSELISEHYYIDLPIFDKGTIQNSSCLNLVYYKLLICCVYWLLTSNDSNSQNPLMRNLTENVWMLLIKVLHEVACDTIKMQCYGHSIWKINN